MAEKMTSQQTKEALFQAGFNPDGSVTIDREFSNVTYSEVCLRCAHFDLDPWLKNYDLRCKAFPTEGIPLVIWNGENLHKEPYAGDHGVQFEEREK